MIDFKQASSLNSMKENLLNHIDFLLYIFTVVRKNVTIFMSINFC